MPKYQLTLSNFLENFCHLPTLIVIALITAILVGRMYQVGMRVGAGFIRLECNRGNITLHWQTGCCHLDW